MAVQMRFPKSLILATIVACFVCAALASDKENLVAFRVTTAKRGGYDWWSLQPVKQVLPPAAGDKGWIRNPIDSFILDGLKHNGLAPSSEAEKRTLIRRLTFDL